MLDGKKAMITGAGRGIGRAAALMMALEGAAVVVNDFDECPAQETVDEIVSGGGSAVVCAGDVTAAGFAERIVTTAIDAFGGLDIIVNNAGYSWDSMVHKMTDEQWQAMLDVHVTSSFRIIRAATPYMREVAKQEIAAGKRVMRKIVNVSSTSGTCGNPGQANYAAAKAGVIGLTKTVAKEWGPFNVNCNAIAFGWIATRMTQNKEEGEKSFDKIPLGVPADVREKIERLVPLGRAGTTREAASGILVLVSPLSDFMNGHVLHVDGGLDM
jgi:3-oxoacyl-[acyl-carrier protein] reductase